MAAAWRVLLFLVAAIAAVAVIVGLTPGASDAVRASLAFGFGEPDRSARAALELYWANVRVAALPLLGSLAGRCAVLRGLLRLYVGITLVLNAVAVGLAFGAYGLRLAPWVPHLPFELAGLSLMTGSHFATGAVRHWRFQLLALGGTAGLMGAGSLIETWCIPLGS